MSETWRLAADVLSDWFTRGAPPRDAIALRPELRRQPPAVRAAVAALAHAVFTRLPWLEFALARAGGLGDLAPLARGAASVLAHEVLADRVLAAGAGRQFATVSRSTVDFAPLLTAAARRCALADPTARFALRHALPTWLAARFLAEFAADAEVVAAALAEPAPRTLRQNPRRCATREQLAAELAAEGVATRPARFAPHALHVDGDADLFATAAFRRGAFEQQDEASQLAAQVVAPPPGGKVLDLCAGSGSKALALAATLKNRGEVMATDVHLGRLQALRERLARSGADNVRMVAIDEHEWPAPVAAFAAAADRILVDAPCSGTGALRRRPEIRHRLGEADLTALLGTQDTLLDRAAAVLRPGARIVYATCSLLAAENEQRVAAFVARQPAFEIVRLKEILGGAAAAPIADATGTFLSLRPDRHGCDGFFAAVLRRRPVS
jgi:16S rRNA (cytosine967-C5)-methyltransferase